MGFPIGSEGKNPPAMQETLIQSPDQEDSLEKEMATHSNILAWRIPWTEEPGRLQSMGSPRVRHDSDFHFLFFFPDFHFLLHSSKLPLVVQLIKNPPAMQETPT